MQHPDEVKHPKGSAIIAKLCLQNIDFFIAEDFSSHTALNQIINEHGKTSILIYPGENAKTFEKKELTSAGITHLIFIDATWRKAKKIFLLSKNLQQLKMIKLSSKLISDYRIRKTPKDGFISSIEAIHYCLQTLHSNPENQLMLDIFKRMIDHQVEKMGHDTFEKNYTSTE